jgi:hypothetical protein
MMKERETNLSCGFPSSRYNRITSRNKKRKGRRKKNETSLLNNGTHVIDTGTVNASFLIDQYLMNTLDYYFQILRMITYLFRGV